MKREFIAPVLRLGSTELNPEDYNLREILFILFCSLEKIRLGFVCRVRYSRDGDHKTLVSNEGCEHWQQKESNNNGLVNK
jgi:hypothetical protein